MYEPRWYSSFCNYAHYYLGVNTSTLRTRSYDSSAGRTPMDWRLQQRLQVGQRLPTLGLPQCGHPLDTDALRLLGRVQCIQQLR